MYKLNLIVFLSIGSTIGPAEEPASIHLSLSKDTLALAEPTMLRVEITNNSANDLLLHSAHAFEFPWELQLFWISPEKEESRFRPYIGYKYSPEAPIYFLLPPGEKASEEIMIWWGSIIPARYKPTLKELPSGVYKLYAMYNLPNENIVIYSDTIEFVFLPFERKYLPILKDISTLFWISNTDKKLEQMKESNTPYSEGAWAALISRIYFNYDSLKTEKLLFDAAYPNSHFTHFLLEEQLNKYLISGFSGVGTPNAKLDTNIGTPEFDSLMILLRITTPNEVTVMKWDEKVKTLSEIDRQELNK